MSTSTSVLDIQDQRPAGSLPILEVDHDLVEAYCGLAGVDLTNGDVVKIRFRNDSGPYGFTSPIKGGYRVVINIRYKKVGLSQAASYVVSNTLLHELRHVAQGQQMGWHSLSHDYDGWSERDARECGRQIKGDDSMRAVR